MTPHHFVVTLTGSSKPLTTDKSVVGYYVTIQPLSANANPVYVGGVSSTGNLTVSSSDYGITIPAPASTVPPAPYPIDPWNTGLRIPLNTIQVLGTNTEKISVMYWA